jgi:dihydrodipicolinate synthase/N-acetylneuraminate lyase
MYQHFKVLEESVDPDFGLIVYNNSGATGSWVKPHVMKRLSAIPNIVALKENTGEFGAFYSMIRTIDPADMVIFTGIGELMYSVEAAYGVVGLFSSMAGFAPELAWEVYEAGCSKDFDRLTELINTRVWPYFQFRTRTNLDHGPNTSVPGAGGGLAGSQYISVIKAAMDIRGLWGGVPRLPLLGLTDNEKAELRDVVKAMKLP